jgi:CBS domain-containing protein
MIARELMSDLIPVVTGNESASMVAGWMDLYRVTHLPVGNEAGFLGLVTEAEILNLPDQEMPVSGRISNLVNAYIIEDQHIYEAIEEFVSHRLTLLPVVDKAKKYMGSITLPDLVSAFSMLTSAGQPGAILEIGMPVRDYTLSTLSRIVEENNARILSLYTSTVPDQAALKVTMKINTPEIRSITRSLERYGYTVGAYFMDNEELDDFYRERYEELMKYMNL